MIKIFLIIGGILNSLLAVFHFFLGYQIFQFEDVAVGYRALMTMLNVGGTLFIILSAIASLCFMNEMITTKLGKLILIFVFLLYFSRAIEELIISPTFSVIIFLVCMVISAIYLVLFLLLLKSQKIVTMEGK